MYALVKTFQNLASGMNAKREALRQHVAARSGMSMAALTLMAMLAAPQAQASVKELTVAVAADGTAGWDQPAQDSMPGYDSGPNNGKVRTNDEVHYRVAISTHPQPDSNVKIVSVLPAGGFAEWLALPSQCTGAGSAISTDKQTLTCVLPSIAASTTENVILRAFVRGSVTKNGDVLQAPSTTLTSAAVASPLQPASNANPVNITAAPFYDAVVQMSYQGNPSAYGFYELNGPNNEDGAYHRPLIGLRAAHPAGWGRKGVERLQGDVTINVDVSNYPAGTRLDDWHGSGTGEHGGASGSFVNSACGSPNNGWPSHESGSSINLFQRVGDTGAAYNGSEPFIVPNGGTCTVTASGGQLAVTISGMDTNLLRRPTQQRGGYDISSDPAWWVSNKALVLWTPLDSYTPNVATPHTVKLLSYQGTSVSGQQIAAVSSVSNNTANDQDSYSMTRRLFGTFSKIYTPDIRPGLPYGTVKDPGESGDDKVNYMAVGQVVAARLSMSNRDSDAILKISACEVIDRTAFDLSMGAELVPGAGFEAQLQGPANLVSRIRYGKRKNGSRYFASTDSSSDPLENGAPGSSEYGGGGGGSGTLHECSDSNPNIEWHDDLASVGEDLVYVRADIERLPGGQSAYLFVRGLKLRKTWANTIAVLSGSQAGITRQAGADIAAGSLIRNRATARSDNYANYAVGNYRDHLKVVPSLTYSRVTKAVKGHTNTNDTPVVAAGDQVRYVLQPRFSTQMPQIDAPYVVTDILPPNLSYVPGSATVAGVAREPVVQADTPAAGFTTLTWDLGTKKPFLGRDDNAGAKLEVIEFSAQVAFTAPVNQTLRNHTAVSGGSNDDQADCTFSSAAPIGYGNCPKAAHTDILVQAAARVSLSKTLQGTAGDIQPGQGFQYRLTYGSNVPVAAEDVPDLIDILPYAGDGASDPSRSFTGRSPATVMSSGAYRLTQVDVASGETVFYTSRAPDEIHNDPRHASNAMSGGATKWCAASDFSTAGCPSDIGAATAVRINPPAGMTIAPGQQHSVVLHFATNPAIAKEGDIYNNSVGAQSPEVSASGLQFIYALADKGVRIRGGVNSLSGKVYADTNDNGEVNTGENGIPNNKLMLYACTVGPNGTVDTTDMGTTLPPTCAGDDILVTYPETLTNAAGEYQFSNLQNGLYKVVQPEQPTGYQNGKTTPGTGPAAVGTASTQNSLPSYIHNIALTGGTVAVNYNFGELPTPAPTIDAVDDDFGSADNGTERVTPSVLGNDDANGTGASTGNVTLTPVALDQTPAAGSIVMNQDGTITVAVGTTPGTYKYTYKICLLSPNETVCDEAVATVVVTAPTPAPTIDAVDDDYNATPIAPGGSTPSVLGNDDANGTGANSSNVTLTPGTPSNSGLTMNPDGSITVKPGTPAGTYTYPYKICLLAPNETVCDEAVATVVVTAPLPVPTIDAVDDDFTVTPIAPGGSTPSVLGNDDANGTGATSSNVTLTPGASPHTGLTMNPDGTITVAPGTPAGTYSYPYKICLLAPNETVCDEAVATVVVTALAPAPTIDAVDDDYSATPIDSGTGGSVPSIVNDTVDGQPAVIGGNVTLTPGAAPHPGLSMGTDGVVTVTPGTPAGTYTHPYTICLVSHPAVCDSATVTVVVAAPKAELAISKVVNNAAPVVGEDVEFTITVSNKGPSAAENVKVTEHLPSGYELVSATPTTGTWSAPVWTIGTLAVGDSAVLKVVATVLPSGDYTNVVTVESSTTLVNAPGTLRAEAVLTPAQVNTAMLMLEKRGSVSQAEMGDVVLYTIRIRNNGQNTALRPVLVDHLPAGFSLLGETAAVRGANLLALTGAPGSVLQMQLDSIAPGAEVTVQYRVRISVGAQQGDGINRAHMVCPVGQANVVNCSNEDQWQIRVSGGVFSSEACVVGQIYVDANGNSVKDREELGIPGVRMYFQDGTYMISDVEGKYSYCGLRPVTHVLKVDASTLPRGSRLVTSSSRNTGDANSLFVDLKAGELHRADFIEGSASNEVLEQVKARRANGEVRSVESEAGQPALKFESKPAPQGSPLQQGTDSVNQLIERSRQGDGR